VDSTLFGHTKGAFSGAIKDTPGYFAEANGGTLFLDEFGELPLDSQVRLLRVLRDGTYTPVGLTQSKTTNIRIIAATNRNLMDEVAAGRFRKDLFYRVAIGILQLPRSKHCYDQSQKQTCGATNKYLEFTRMIDITMFCLPIEEQNKFVEIKGRVEQYIRKIIEFNSASLSGSTGSRLFPGNL